MKLQGKNMKDNTDFELIQLYINGNNRAFEVLYSRYRNKLYAFIRYLLSSADSEVDDVFQAVWVKAIDKMPTLRDNGSFFGYLQQIARNIIIDNVRKFKRRGVHVAIDDDEAMPIADENTPEPYFDISDTEERKLLQDAVKTLSDEQRRVWEYRMQDLSFKEIAAKEKCSINTVLGRMNYAKKNILIYLETHR